MEVDERAPASGVRVPAWDTQRQRAPHAVTQVKHGWPNWEAGDSSPGRELHARVQALWERWGRGGGGVPCSWGSSSGRGDNQESERAERQRW